MTGPREPELTEVDNAVLDLLMDGADTIGNIAMEVRCLSKSVSKSIRKLRQLGMVHVSMQAKAFNGHSVPVYELTRTKKAA